MRSHRGIAGGYSLGRPADKISVRDLVELLEGIETDRCSLSLDDDCPILGRCSIRRKMSKLEDDFMQSLAGLTLDELAKDIRTTPPKTKAKS